MVWDRLHGCWQASIEGPVSMYTGKAQVLWSGASEEQAARVYDDACRRTLLPAVKVLNFPRENDVTGGLLTSA